MGKTNLTPVPTETTVLDLLTTTKTITYPCEGTDVNKCLVTSSAAKSNGAEIKRVSGVPYYMAWLFFLSFLVSAVFADEGSSVTLLPAVDIPHINTDNLTTAIDIVSSQVEAGIANNMTVFAVGTDAEKLLFISNFTLTGTGNDTTLAKRWDGSSAPLGASWTQHQVARQGTWWAKWYPKSCAIGNSKSERDTVWQVETSSTYSVTVSADFSMDVAEGAALGMGLSVTTSNSQSYQGTFTIPAGGWGQVWTRQNMVWQDQQKQHCHKYHYGSGGIKCGAWSAYIHADIPTKHGSVFTWSTGYNNMDMDSCGGGTSWQL